MPAGASASFSEREMQAEILRLIEDKKVDRATKALIDILPKLHSSNVNIKEKLNNLLFLSRVIQNAGGSKYGQAKLRSKIKTLASFTRQYDLPSGGFVELGCGAHDPAALSTFFYLNGLTPAYGVDLLEPRTDFFSALSMYDILANVKMFPGRYVWKGLKPFDILVRLRDIAVAEFEDGNFQAGIESMGGAVRLICDDFLDCAIAPGSIALLTSFAVLEHVKDIDAIMRRCFQLMAPGGIAYHFNDLADHRSYRGDGVFGALSFLTEEDAPANMNRLRAPQIAEAARKAGFELLTDQRISAKLEPELRAKLVKPFADMPPADVSVVKQHLVLRKSS
jgi:hypothetical protein